MNIATSSLFCVLLNLSNILIIFCFNLNSKYVQVFDSITAKNYFGYSVLLQNGKHSSVVVGSPKSNCSIGLHQNVREPGTIFRCYLYNNTCIEYSLNGEDPPSFTDYITAIRYTRKFEGAFIGNAIDGGSNSEDPIVVCGSRWVLQRSAADQFANGICYLLNNPLMPTAHTQNLIPLIDPDKQGYVNDEQSYYYYALGQAGMAVKYLEQSGKILIGAPGVMNWKGTCVTYNTYENLDLPPSRRKRSTPASYRLSRIPNPIFNSKFKSQNNTYFGYDVDHGRFIKNSEEIWYVSGAPRGDLLRGQVLLFEMPPDNDKDLIIKGELVGDQVGAYFGSSLLVIDLNNDGADDLLVGAPMYSNNAYDEGGVYLYMNDGKGVMEGKSKLFGIPQRGSRFGTSISNLGDINDDNYKDVAISAPYEDEGRGSIYIYLGSEKGLRESYSQHIVGSSLNMNLGGFGFSLSRGVDVDANLYNDLAVGAYKSGHVVVLKSQPVLKFRTTLKPDIKEILITVKQFTLNYCLTFTSKTKLKEFEANLEILVLFGGSDYKSIQQMNVTLSSGSPSHCNNTVIAIMDGASKSVPLTAKMNYALINTDCLTCPITDPEDRKFSEIEIPFINGCGSDNICQYNLMLDATFSPPTTNLIIGERNSIDIDINLSNVGEPSYLTKLFTQIPFHVRLVRTPKQCTYQHPILECNMGNPLTENSKSNLKIEIDLKNLNSAQKTLEFNVRANGSGHEENTQDNSKKLKLNLQSKINIAIGGSSTPRQLVYRRENKTLLTDLKFSQEFTIQNLGPTLAEMFSIDFLLPKYIREVKGQKKETFMKIFKPMAYVDGQSIACTVADGSSFDIEVIKGKTSNGLKDSETNVNPRDQITTNLEKNNTMTNFAALTSESTVADLPSNRTLYLNCSSQNFDIECMHVKCDSGHLKTLGARIVIKFDFIADFKVIGSYMKKNDIALYSTKSLVAIDGKMTDHYLHTILLGERLHETIPWWIILLSILIAILLIALIVYALWKLGFFKREMKEELLQAKQDDDNTSFVNPTAETQLNE